MITVFKQKPGQGISAEAERYALSLTGKKYYIATLDASSEEDKIRVEKCRNRREGMDFVTIEQSTAILNAVDKIKWMESLLGSTDDRKIALIECIPNLCANEVALEDGLAKDIVNKVLFGFAFLKEYFDDIVVVTDDSPVLSDYYTKELPNEKKTVYEEAVKELNTALYSYADEII